MIPFSVLDLSPIVEGGDAAQALRNTLDLARHAERWGYQRYWLAEHHNMPRLASAATSVVIGAVAGRTSTIRVGAGGIMLPNHSPLVIAEQFGTLESLFPGRIDLGLGRAPGIRSAHRSRAAAEAGRRRHVSAGRARAHHLFPRRSGPTGPGGSRARAEGSRLDSRIELVRRAARGRAGTAVRVRVAFRAGADDARDRRLPGPVPPSQFLARPHLMLGVNVVAADTDEEAKRLFTSHQQAFVNLRRGTPGPLPPPDPGFLERISVQERWEDRSDLVGVGRWIVRERAGGV